MDHPPTSFSLSTKLTHRCCLLMSLLLCGFWSNRQMLLKYPIAIRDGTSVVSPPLGVWSFSGNKSRTFEGWLPFASTGQSSFLRNPLRKMPTVREFPRFAPNCDQWVVAMLGDNDHGKDSESSLALVKSWADWCTIILMDDEGSSYHDALKQKHENDKMIFLSVAQQAEIPHPFAQQVLWSLRKKDAASKGIRKNIGYLFAIRHGAKAIFDFELSGHQGISESWLPFGSSSPSRVLVGYTKNHHNDKNSLPLFNPLPHMVSSKSYVHKRLFPRGFPVNATLLEDNEKPLPSYYFGSVEHSSVGVVHSVSRDDIWGIDGDESDMLFDSDLKTRSRVLMPAEHFTPYSAKSTAYLHQAFWGLLLPSTVPGEMADIWRAYVAQPFLQDLQLAVISESTTHHPNVPAKKNWISSFNSEEAHAWEEKLPSLLQFLASEDSSTGRHDSNSSSYDLPARIERLTVGLYERGFVGLDDVYATQEWLLALRDMGYDFPTKKVEQTKLVHAEPSLENQPYLASPAFNMGKNGELYMDHVSGSKRPASLELYNEWLQEVKTERRNDDGVIVKLVTMTKNEWPLIKDWIWYHGELIGFENIYLLDGSSDPRSIAFLVHARDHLGVNVIFSSAGLNQLEEQMSKIGREISKASDFVLKMDVDEFIVAHKEGQTCIHSTDRSSEGGPAVDCSLSPYAVLDAINDLRRIATGERLRVGYVMWSQSNLAVCSSDNTKNDISAFPLGPVENAGGFKTISDSRTLAGLDLGGHNNFFVAPFGASAQVGNQTDLGVLHFHSRCLDTEVSNCRKALVSHNFIEENDTDEVAKAKLMEQHGIKGDEVDLCMITSLDGVSWGKVLFYLKYLHGCIGNDTFYGSTENTFLNPDFQKFLHDAKERHRRFDI